MPIFGRRCLFSLIIYFHFKYVLFTRSSPPSLSALLELTSQLQIRCASPVGKSAVLFLGDISPFTFTQYIPNDIGHLALQEFLCLSSSSEPLRSTACRVDPLQLRIGYFSCCYLIGPSRTELFRTEPASISESPVHLISHNAIFI